MKSKGFGDTVEKVAKAVGADKVAKVYDAINRGLVERTGIHIPFPSKDMTCGCSKRKDSLNRNFPYNK